MPNKKYLSGRRFEYAVKHRYEKMGYIVIRSAGSKSPFDLVAIKPDARCVLLIQCKHGKMSMQAKLKLESGLMRMLWIDNSVLSTNEFKLFCEVVTK